MAELIGSDSDLDSNTVIFSRKRTQPAFGFLAELQLARKRSLESGSIKLFKNCSFFRIDSKS